MSRRSSSHRLHQLRAERDQVPLAQQPFAHAVRARHFLLPPEFFFLLFLRIGLELLLPFLVALPQLVDVFLVIVAAHQLVLAARKKSHEVAQKFAGVSQPLELVQLELGDMPPQQDPVVHVLDRLQIRIRDGENFLQAEFVERAQPHALRPLAHGSSHAVQHLARGFIRERQPQNVFARELRIGLKQIANPFGNHACLAGPGPGDHEQRPLAVLHSRALLVGKRKSLIGGFWSHGSSEKFAETQLPILPDFATGRK